ncbi:MAG: hypothetical protein MUP71_01975 [Candidatus Aminicenantes bacterium]|nr:hypothetical protein [Candidatus Aminicenantes bacterium]
MKKKFVLSVVLLHVLFLCCLAEQKDFPLLQGPYFGQKPPGAAAEIFLPEVFNMYKYLHGKLVFSPDGKEVFWVVTTTAGDGSAINMRMFIKQKIDGTWAAPVDSFFSIAHKENGPCYSSDEKRLYYQSRAPLNGNGGNKDLDIWYRERKGEGWSEPQNIGCPVNTAADESQPWVTGNGSIFFCRDNKTIVNGQAGGSDIYFSQYANGSYSDPVLLGAEINSEYAETEPTMAPDNSYLLFISNRPGGFSRMMNLYVSFRTADGGWTRALCLSQELKIENIWFPTLTYDGKYLFFCGGYPSPHNGYDRSNYYWLDARQITDLKTN